MLQESLKPLQVKYNILSSDDGAVVTNIQNPIGRNPKRHSIGILGLGTVTFKAGQFSFTNVGAFGQTINIFILTYDLIGDLLYEIDSFVYSTANGASIVFETYRMEAPIAQ